MYFDIFFFNFLPYGFGFRWAGDATNNTLIRDFHVVLPNFRKWTVFVKISYTKLILFHVNLHGPVPKNPVFSMIHTFCRFIDYKMLDPTKLKCKYIM